MARFFKSILSKFTREAPDWDDLEETLISGDLGVHLSMEIIEELRELGRKVSADDLVEVCRERILEILGPQPPALTKCFGQPTVILVVGVNGVGKTTSIAKLAHHLHLEGNKVILAAGDTFRAAAIEQLEIWAERIGIPIIKGAYQADPSSLCYDAHESAVKQGADYLICDTAGRLHTRHNLMEELKKIHRTLGKKDSDSPHEILLVVDATTGSNALSQAREFGKTLDLSGLIVTKLDGSGKGGVCVSIKKELNIPTRFVGTGEAIEDFKPFDPQSFVEEIL